MESEYDEFGNFIGELPPEVDADSLPGDDDADGGVAWDEDDGAYDGAQDHPARPLPIRSMSSCSKLY